MAGLFVVCAILCTLRKECWRLFLQEMAAYIRFKDQQEMFGEEEAGAFCYILLNISISRFFSAQASFLHPLRPLRNLLISCAHAFTSIASRDQNWGLDLRSRIAAYRAT